MSQFEAKDTVNRPLAQFPADLWTDNFINFSDQDNARLEKYGEEIEPLKEEVRGMLIEDKYGSVGQKMILINTVERLGVSYFYKNEIKELLDCSFKMIARNNFEIDTNLCETALQFRIFRQHGYKFPSGVFTKFTNGEGKFEETLKSDVKGMMNLYEAAHLRVHGEDILEEAILFTNNFLKMVANSSNEAGRALKYPLHRTIPRVDTKYFISFYEEDESRNETLLRLAKIDFNRLQLLYRKELSQLQKWWNSLSLVKKLPYIRSRIVESYFTANGTYFEPQYSKGRMLLAKYGQALGVLDDTYDAYGTLEELLLLTDAFERWDLSLMDQLSNSMKIVYQFIINLFEDFVKETLTTGKSYTVSFIKEITMDVIRCYMEEVKKQKEGVVQSYEEYMADFLVTGLGRAMLVTSLMGMDEIRDEKPFQVIKQVPKPTIVLDLIARITNAIYTHEAEQARGQVPSAVECYMKEYGTKRDETVEIFQKMIDDAWKDLNEELLSIPNTIPKYHDHDHHDHDLDGDEKKEQFPKLLLKLIIDICRMVNVLYEGNDGYTCPSEFISTHIITLYVLPFSI